MNKLVIAATHQGSGKTDIIVGIGKASGKKIGYLKPFGNKLRYDKKRLWDYDAALMKSIFGLKEEPEELSIGFEHARLKYAYDAKTAREKVVAEMTKIGTGKELVFIEGGSNLTYGASIHLDIISLADYTKGRLVIVISGSEYDILDDILFIKKYVATKHINFGGVIINKVADVEDFKQTHLAEITEMGIKVLGVLPYEQELTYLPVELLADNLFAKVLTGREKLRGMIKTIFIGAMSATAAQQNLLFKKEKKLVITSGDRSDMILAALESDTACIILTNNILPAANIVSKASEANIPLLLVSWDTYDTVMRIHNIEPLLTKNDTEKIELLEKIVRKYIDLKELV